MRYPVVEECEGFDVCCVPASEGRLQKYTAQFGSKALFRTPFRFTFELAKQEGAAIMKQVRHRLGQQQDEGRQARHVPEPNTSASSSMDCSEQVPRKIQALNSRQDSRPHARQVHHQQRLPSASAGSSVGAQPAAAAGGSAAVLVPPALAPNAGVAAAGVSHTGSFVNLLARYHGGFPGACVQLGSCIGTGGFANVYQGTVLPMNGQPNTLQGYQRAAAAAAGSARCEPCAVKMFHHSRPGTADDMMQKCLKQELHALQRLRFHRSAVQLLAEGEIVASSGCSTQHAAGSQDSQSCSARSKQQKQPNCAVLELCPHSLQDVLRKTRCGEPTAKYVAASVLQLLAYCQSGQLDCVLVHRDLKPANVLIRKDNTVAVADFGACHIVELWEVADRAPAAAATAVAGVGAAGAASHGTKRHLTQPQQQHPASVPDPAAVAAAVAVQMHDGIGTPFYAAPEVYGLDLAAAAKPHGSGSGTSTAAAAADDGACSRSYDASVDVYALGVIVAEMLLGSLPAVSKIEQPRSAEQVLQWNQWLGDLVDGQVALPEGLQVSPAALQFIGCCCGVGREREEAAARGEAKRLKPKQLQAAAWLQRK